MYATITSKGQVTLPKALRDQLHLSVGDKLEFVLDEDQLSAHIIPKHQPVTSLKGMLPKPQQAVSLQEMEQAIERGAGR